MGDKWNGIRREIGKETYQTGVILHRPWCSVSQGDRKLMEKSYGVSCDPIGC